MNGRSRFLIDQGEAAREEVTDLEYGHETGME
jgi:hypothetical protein